MQRRNESDDKCEPAGGEAPCFDPAERVLRSLSQSAETANIKPGGKRKRNNDSWLERPVAAQLREIMRPSLMREGDGRRE